MRQRRADAAGKALTAVIQEACIQGISARSVDELVKAMGMTMMDDAEHEVLAGSPP